MTVSAGLRLPATVGEIGAGRPWKPSRAWMNACTAACAAGLAGPVWLASTTRIPPGTFGLAWESTFVTSGEAARAQSSPSSP